MKTHLKFLLGLVFMVFVFGGCQDPSRIEIPEENLTKVEFVWGIDPQVVETYNLESDNGRKTFYANLSSYFLGLKSDQNGKYYEYPKDYERYNDFANTTVEDFKKLYEDAFKKVFGTKYYKEGTTIYLEEWTLPAKDLISGDSNPFYSRLYFLAKDIRKTDYDKDNYIDYIDYLDKNSFDKIEVHNEDIKVYIYWRYFQ